VQKKARNAINKYGLRAIYPKPKLSVKNAEHKVYTYLLKDLDINLSNQDWAPNNVYQA
jgi:putative transposase